VIGQWLLVAWAAKNRHEAVLGLTTPVISTRGAASVWLRIGLRCLIGAGTDALAELLGRRSCRTAQASRLQRAPMLKDASDPDQLRQLLLAILSTSGTLAGISMALVGIINLRVVDTKTESIADDMFLLSSLGFLVVCFLVFFTLRRLQSATLRRWTAAIDILFLSSMTLLVLSGFVVLYAFGLAPTR
jgi:hypothetical protein